MVDDPDASLERIARPLLELVQRLTGLETSFVTTIDIVGGRQDVVLALNSGELNVAEGSVVDWADSMCRLAFVSGKEHSSNVPTDFPGSIGATVVGMKTFFAVPIVDGGTTVGTVCGASGRRVDLDSDTIENMRLIADALASQLATETARRIQAERARRANELAMVDSLTDLANRRAFDARLKEELSRADRHDLSLAVMMLDVDEFKLVNDSFGHPGGDTVLRQLAAVLREAARQEDVVARLGGDEFAVLLSSGNADGAAALGARIIEQFHSATAAIGMPATASIGISSTEWNDPQALLAAADAALYRAKADGRNRVVVAQSIDLSAVSADLHD